MTLVKLTIRMMNAVSLTAVLCALACTIVGCGELVPEPAARFEPNRVFAYHMAQEAGEPIDAAIQQVNHALTDLYGTPEEPKLPAFVLDDPDYSSIVSIDHLKKAAGANGLFRRHCTICHGVTGNGRGTSAALLNPYPRDFRLGKFKFKSTRRGAKPLKDDIAFLIEHGIPGTPMVKIPELNDQAVQALVDYVIYLSWRGEVERLLIDEASFVDMAAGEAIYDPSVKESDAEAFAEQLEILEEIVLEIGDSWLDSEDGEYKVPTRDPEIVPDTIAGVLAAMQNPEDAVRKSVERGQQLFVSDAASCAKCHGKEGRGNGQTNDYDDWTKDWTIAFRLAPDDEAALIPLIARGALPPRKVSPRDFQAGVFRGGHSPERIFRRIAQGIDGTPMPAAALTPEQIWDLVNYVRSLHVPKEASTENLAQAL